MCVDDTKSHTVCDQFQMHRMFPSMVLCITLHGHVLRTTNLNAESQFHSHFPLPYSFYSPFPPFNLVSPVLIVAISLAGYQYYVNDIL